MESDNVVNGLLCHIQQVADQLELVQAQMRQLVLDIDALDSTLRLFKPDVAIDVVCIKPIPGVTRRCGTSPAASYSPCCGRPGSR